LRHTVMDVRVLEVFPQILRKANVEIDVIACKDQ
jgi:hypothetical protein